MGLTLADTAAQIKSMVREILGDMPSKMFLARVDAAIDEGASDKESLAKACARVENITNLFIGVNEAKVIGSRCKEILGKMG